MRRAEEGRELPHASEKRPFLLGARPGSAARGDASLLLRVGPAGRSCQAAGREASIQDPVWGPATTALQRSVVRGSFFVRVRCDPVNSMLKRVQSILRKASIQISCAQRNLIVDLFIYLFLIISTWCLKFLISII